MEASTAFRAPIAVRLDAPVLAKLGRMLALSAVGLLAVTGLVVCLRRATGALVEPLAPGVLAGVGVVLAALAMLFRRAFSSRPRSRAAGYALCAAPSVVLAIWAAAVSLAGSDALGLVVLFGALLLEEGYSWGRLSVRGDLSSQRGNGPAVPLAVSTVTIPSDEVRGVLSTDAASDETITQHVVRRHDAAGEVIEGWLRVDFAAAQRHATAHLAICPPLDCVPQCFAEQMDGPPARIKVAQVLEHGVRFELKLDQPAVEPARVVVEFSIQEHPADELEDAS